MREIRLKEQFKVELSRDEVERSANDLAQAIDDLKKLEDQRRETNRAHKELIDHKKAEIKRYADMVRNRYEYRSVDCVMRYDYEALKVYFIRLDTGEIFSERPMLDHEKQTDIDDMVDLVGNAEPEEPEAAQDESGGEYEQTAQ